jgi:hypothetical protein
MVRSPRELRELAEAAAAKGGYLDHASMMLHFRNAPSEVVESEIPRIPFRLLYCLAGGVGEIYASAGVEEKRRMLIEHGLTASEAARALDK